MECDGRIEDGIRCDAMRNLTGSSNREKKYPRLFLSNLLPSRTYCRGDHVVGTREWRMPQRKAVLNPTGMVERPLKG